MREGNVGGISALPSSLAALLTLQVDRALPRQAALLKPTVILHQVCYTQSMLKSFSHTILASLLLYNGATED